jgi:hypothetical protein
MVLTDSSLEHLKSHSQPDVALVQCSDVFWLFCVSTLSVSLFPRLFAGSSHVSSAVVGSCETVEIVLCSMLYYESRYGYIVI